MLSRESPALQPAVASPCHDAQSCLSERRAVLSFPVGDPRAWVASECLNCGLGRARMMAEFVPEEDAMPQRGPKPKGSCGKGHLRSEWGRWQTRKFGGAKWACRKCEKELRDARRRAG